MLYVIEVFCCLRLVVFSLGVFFFLFRYGPDILQRFLPVILGLFAFIVQKIVHKATDPIPYGEFSCKKGT